MNVLHTLAPARPALALGLVLLLGAAARGQEEDASSTASDPESSGGSSWACFVISVAALGGLYALVRRRQREAAAAWHRGRLVTWYCRACDRDVSGPACPHCQAPNPFLDAPTDHESGPGRRGPRRSAAGMRFSDD